MGQLLMGTKLMVEMVDMVGECEHQTHGELLRSSLGSKHGWHA